MYKLFCFFISRMKSTNKGIDQHQSTSQAFIWLKHVQSSKNHTIC